MKQSSLTLGLLVWFVGMSVLNPMAGRAASNQAAAPIPPAPLSPEESRQRIRLPDGFQVELAAAEPLVLDPVAFDWDERGRLWVVEMADYPMGMDGNGKPGGRVRILEDSNHDGVYDRATLFAEGLSFPTGILTWRDGCLVTAAPDILRLADRDGDGRAEIREVLFTGFNTGNQQLRINGLRWAVDGWVYCANGGHNVNYGKDVNITAPRTGTKVALGARDFRFKPDTGELDPLSGPAQFGRTRDAWGRWFGVQNSYPLWHYVLEDYYLRRNPHVAPPNPKVLLTESNPRVYPALEPEQRYHNFAQAGRFTSACGPLIVLDPLLFGPAAPGVEDAFTCEPVHGVVQRLRLTPDGVTFRAERTGGETDFFASGDRWCRPVMVRTGPDGALWVADMYRYMIEHPQWLPEVGRKDLSPHYRIGEDRGRIYRIFPSGRRPPVAPALGSLDTGALVRALDSENGWTRDKAQMLLQWRNDKAAVPLLQRMTQGARTPVGRMHALHALAHFNALTDQDVIAALKNREPGVRIHALALAERFSSDQVVAAAVKLSNDGDARVRLQLACSLGAWRQGIAGETLAAMAVREQSDAHFSGAIASSMIPHLRTIAERLADGGTFAETLFRTALGEKRDDVILAVLRAPLERSAIDDRASLERARSTLTLLRAHNETLESLAARHPHDPRWNALVTRRDALLRAVQARLPAAAPQEQAFLATLLLCDPRQEEAALERLGQLLSPRHGLHPIGEYASQIARLGPARGLEVLLRDWGQRTPGDRTALLDAIMSRESWLLGLLEHVASGAIPPASFDAQRQARLVRHPNPAIKRKADTVFASSRRPRAQVIESFRPTLTLAGDPRKGREVFAQVCAACHQLGGTGVAIGPDLRSVIDHPPEKLLISILDPSADIQPGYAAYFCELAGGEQLYGAIVSETGGSLTFRLADGSTRAIVRGQIVSLQSSNVSLMPEGIEATLTPQSLSDLIAYLKKGHE